MWEIKYCVLPVIYANEGEKCVDNKNKGNSRHLRDFDLIIFKTARSIEKV